MRRNILEKISFLRLTGIQVFVTLELDTDSVRISIIKNKMSSFKIDRSNDFDDFTVVQSIVVHLSEGFTSLSGILKKFISDNSLHESYVIISLGQFRFNTVKVLKEDYDSDDWFEENKSKYTPGGSAADDFIISFEKLGEEDDFLHFAVCIARQDDVSSIIEICSDAGLQTLSVFPFEYAVHTNQQNQSENVICLDFNSSHVKYSYSDSGGNIVLGSTNNVFMDEDELKNRDSLNDFLISIRESFDSASKDAGKEIRFYYSSPILFYKDIKEHIKGAFPSCEINNELSKDFQQLFLPLSALQKISSDFNEQINLAEDKCKSMVLEKLEKTIAMRFILAVGMIMVVSLLIIYVSENLLIGFTKGSEDKLIEFEANNSMIEKEYEENLKMQSNLILLNSLKSGENRVSVLLEEFVGVVSDKCSLSGIFIKEEKPNGILTEIKGRAVNQIEVASVLRRMEQNGKFDSISLLYSNSTDLKNSRGNRGSYPKGFIFKISATYKE